MEILNTITRYATAFIDGTAYRNFMRMDNESARNTMFKVFAVAVITGIVTAFVAPSLVPVLFLIASAGMFSHETLNFDFEAAAAAAKKSSRRS